MTTESEPDKKQEEEEIELLPCAACGGRAIFSTSTNIIGEKVRYVRCILCNLRTTGHVLCRDEYVAEAWNYRCQPDSRTPAEDGGEEKECICTEYTREHQSDCPLAKPTATSTAEGEVERIKAQWREAEDIYEKGWAKQRDEIASLQAKLEELQARHECFGTEENEWKTAAREEAKAADEARAKLAEAEKLVFKREGQLNDGQENYNNLKAKLKAANEVVEDIAACVSEHGDCEHTFEHIQAALSTYDKHPTDEQEEETNA